MKADYLKFDELVNFGEGHISIHGRRLMLHSVQADAHFRKDLLDLLGVSDARRLMTRFGFFWGNTDAATMLRLFSWDDSMEALKAGFKLLELEGMVNSVIRSLSWDEDNKKFYASVEWENSGEAEEHLESIGSLDIPVCWKIAGYISGFATKCLGQDIYFVGETCRGKGDKNCCAVGMDRDSWGEGLNQHIEYFEAEDIKGEVDRLTLELERKNTDIGKHQKKIKNLQLADETSFVDVRSESLRQVLTLAGRVATFDSSVMITGETGVGKEVMARYIHTNSHKAKGPFIAINCGALPESLLETELFGHKAGSFTGATRDRTGLFEEACDGTIFLDEIGEISPSMQMKILRVLQEKEIRRIGENKNRKINSRIISATNRDLNKAVAEGRFREDLLYRLRVIEIEIPPLRDRREDILPLTRYLLKKVSKRLNLNAMRLDTTSIDPLVTYHWPGNVRELENVLERAAVLSTDGSISPDCMPHHIVYGKSFPQDTKDPVSHTLAQMERKHIKVILESTHGNQSRAAKILGISSTTLWRKLKQYA